MARTGLLGSRHSALGLRAGSWLLISCLPPSRSLRNFFRRASDMLYFKRLIQIPRLPEVPAPSSGRRRGLQPSLSLRWDGVGGACG